MEAVRGGRPCFHGMPAILMGPAGLYCLAMFAAAILLLLGQSGGAELRMDFETAQPQWHAIRLVDDGARGKAAGFADRGARIDAGLVPVDSHRAFTVAMSI